VKQTFLGETRREKNCYHCLPKVCKNFTLLQQYPPIYAKILICRQPR